MNGKLSEKEKKKEIRQKSLEIDIEDKYTSWDSEWEAWRMGYQMTTKRMKCVQGKPVGGFHSGCRKLFKYEVASTLRPLQCGWYVPIVHSSIVHLALFKGTTMVVGCCCLFATTAWLPEQNEHHYIIKVQPLLCHKCQCQWVPEPHKECIAECKINNNIRLQNYIYGESYDKLSMLRARDSRREV